MWALIVIYYRQRKEIELLKKQLKARPKSKDDGLNPDIKALAKSLKVSYQRAEEIFKRSKINKKVKEGMKS
jgi:hypothetical protein